MSRRSPPTLDDHQRSRWIVEPLHLFDCCLLSPREELLEQRERVAAVLRRVGTRAAGSPGSPSATG